LTNDETNDSMSKPWGPDECECQQALRTSEYENFKARNPDRIPDTCQWFLRHQNFHAWHQSEVSALLWISADPGCGKSVLAKSLIDIELKSTRSRTTCYFFFKDDDSRQKSVTHALCALLHQLFDRKPFLLGHAVSQFRSEGIKLLGSFFKLWNILTAAAADPNAGEIICVLDALDECEESSRFELIEAVNRYYSESGKNQANLKFVVTSRPYSTIEQRFAKLTTKMPTIRLQGEDESELISKEINLVIKSRVPEIGVELELTKLEESKLEDRLLKVTHRTYLWLKLIFEVIRQRQMPDGKVTEKSLVATVDTLPETVDKAYEEILRKSTNENLARKLLCIIVAAARPLTVEEMNIALAIKDDSKSYEDLDLEPEHRFSRYIKNLCGLFVNVIDKKVYLIHQTAKEFLLAKSEAASTGWKQSIEPALSELTIAKTCIAYLLFPDFKRSLNMNGAGGENKSVNMQTDKHPYLAYAASEWAQHFRKAQRRADSRLIQSVLNICDTESELFHSWFSVYQNLVIPYKAVGLDSSLILASFFGHDTVVKVLLDRGQTEVDFKDVRGGRTSLSYASRNGHEEVVKLLLDGKADVKSVDIFDTTPLSHAAYEGHSAVVELLLDTGKADVNSKDSIGRSPLSYAASHGRKAVVKLLLGTDEIDVNSRDRIYDQTILIWAVEFGQEACIKLLLDTGVADINGTDKAGKTPLFWAVSKGHQSIVELLLDTGKADINLGDESGQTPLSLAVKKGQEAIVKLLENKQARS
jgi:ankyrin repeat protein